MSDPEQSPATSDPAKFKPGSRSRASLGKQVEFVLDRKGYRAELPLLMEMMQSFEYNSNLIMLKIKFYKYGGLVLLIAIPVVSTIIASIVNISECKGSGAATNWCGAWALPTLTLCLALLTVLNSIFKPSVRFARVAQIGVELFHWRCEFLRDLEAEDSWDDKKLMALLTEKLKTFQKIEEAQIDLALPDLNGISAHSRTRDEQLPGRHTSATGRH